MKERRRQTIDFHGLVDGLLRSRGAVGIRLTALECVERYAQESAREIGEESVETLCRVRARLATSDPIERVVQFVCWCEGFVAAREQVDDAPMAVHLARAWARQERADLKLVTDLLVVLADGRDSFGEIARAFETTLAQIDYRNSKRLEAAADDFAAGRLAPS